MDDITIREAELEDVPGIARVQVETWRTAYRGIVADIHLDAMRVTEREGRWRELFSGPSGDRRTLAAVAPSGEIVGWSTSLREREGNPVYTGELAGIYVLKEFQGQGIGCRLVSKIAEGLAGQGHTAALVWTLEKSPYRRFYEALDGQYLSSKPYEVAGITLTQVSYGWLDLRSLILS